MTYHATTTAVVRRVRRRKKRAADLGIWPFDQISEWVTGGDVSDCLNDANAKVAPLDSSIQDMARNWNPSGFYTPDQVLSVVAHAFSTEKPARAHVTAAPDSTSDAEQMRKIALDRLDEAGQKSLDFITAANTAKTQGIKVVDAPGLKYWAISTMEAASAAHTTAYVLECAQSGLATAYASFEELFVQVAGVVKQIIGVVVQAGDAILHLPDTVSDIAPYLKWGILAGVAVFAYIELRKHT